MSSKFGAALLAGQLASISAAALAAPVSLDEAVEKAVSAAPLLSANEAAIAAAEAGKRQAGSRLNPTLSADAENFIGSGPIDLFRQAEVTVTYSQQIERGGKRSARIALADSDIRLAQAQAQVARLDYAAQVQRAYIDAQIASAALDIADFRLRTERDLQREALRRVRGYKDPLFVETRAAARVAQAEIGLDEAERRSRNARAALAAFWGGTGDDIEIADGFSESGNAAMQLTAADEAAGEALVARAQTAVILEQSKATPDYTVSGGLRFLRNTDDVAAVAGIAIPIGRFDRNRGNIERAQAQRRQAEFLAEANRLERLRRLAALRANADAARTRADRIVAEVYPRAVRTLEQVRAGYNRGGFSFRDIQDAADAILASQDQWLAAMIEYRDLQTELDRLTGRFANTPAVETLP